MPHLDTSDRPGVGVTSTNTQDEPPLETTIPLRRPDGALSRFDEIVTPHPVVAFLFRRRTFIVLLGMLAMVPFARPRVDWFIAGGILAVLAEMLRIWAAGTIHKTEELTTGGPYAFVRHPLYVGSAGHTIAYCLMSGRWESFAFAIPLFLALYLAAASTEEAMLIKLFGERYTEYSRRVPRFIPRFGAIQPGHGEFCWRQVWVNKENTNLVWAVVLCGLFVFQLILHRR